MVEDVSTEVGDGGAAIGTSHGGSVMSSLAEVAPPSPSEPSLVLKQWPGNEQRILSQDEGEIACMLAARDWTFDQIRDSVGCGKKTLRRFIHSRPAKARIKYLKTAKQRAEVEQDLGLVGLLPKARTVLNEAMDRGNTKERSQVAQWLHEAVISKPVQKVEHKIQGKLSHDLTPLFAQMGEALQALKQANSGRDPLSRVQIGTEKLVRALPSGDEEK